MDRRSFTAKAKRMVRDRDDDLETMKELLEPVIDAIAGTGPPAPSRPTVNR